MVGQAQLPVVVEHVFQRHVEGLVVVADLAVIRLAKEGRALDRTHFAVDCRNAAIEHRLGAGELGVDHQSGVG
ncbi:hypothetical protein D3C72_2280460 [compost metagenome]